MASTRLNYLNQIYNAYAPFYTGVVRIMDEETRSYGSGALLYDGRAILTAAHVIDNSPSQLKIMFESSDENEIYKYTSSYSLFGSYSTQEFSAHDLALIWLDEQAPPLITRYDIFRDSPVGSIFNFSGYGALGTGTNGIDESQSTDAKRIQAYNKFEAYYDDLPSIYDGYPQAELVADFDSGFMWDNSLSELSVSSDLGLGEYEGIPLPGDSGGPAWVDNKIAAIVKGVTKFDENQDEPYGSFGDIGVWTDIAHPEYQQWIDQSLRNAYPNVPQSAQEVQKFINEGQDGDINLVYFFLEFHGIRDYADQWLSVDYSTRDGSAKSSIDYISTSGTLILYPGETSAVIPVEIIGNDTPEPNREFYLDVYNPVGGNFSGGAQVLSASRTIVDDDGLFIA
jgi:V8-like Glu-specific endopeptidase